MSHDLSMRVDMAHRRLLVKRAVLSILRQLSTLIDELLAFFRGVVTSEIESLPHTVLFSWLDDGHRCWRLAC
jgi:hypothetical protein